MCLFGRVFVWSGFSDDRCVTREAIHEVLRAGRKTALTARAGDQQELIARVRRHLVRLYIFIFICFCVHDIYILGLFVFFCALCSRVGISLTARCVSVLPPSWTMGAWLSSATSFLFPVISAVLALPPSPPKALSVGTEGVSVTRLFTLSRF